MWAHQEALPLRSTFPSFRAWVQSDVEESQVSFIDTPMPASLTWENFKWVNESVALATEAYDKFMPIFVILSTI